MVHIQKDAERLNRTLRASGVRLTPQRALILRILQEAQEHLDAESIWHHARLQDQSLNLATVYRTLNTLVRVGLIEQSYLGEGQKRAYYELVDKPTHYHFACVRCGRVMELESERIPQAHKDLEQRYGVRILNVHLKFEGLCPDCAAAPGAEA